MGGFGEIRKVLYGAERLSGGGGVEEEQKKWFSLPNSHRYFLFFYTFPVKANDEVPSLFLRLFLG